MKIPAEVRLRQEEMRRAAAVSRESEPCGGERERTIADDCAVMLEACFEAIQHNGKAVVLRDEMQHLARQMRAVGDMARYLPVKA